MDHPLDYPFLSGVLTVGTCYLLSSLWSINSKPSTPPNDGQRPLEVEGILAPPLPEPAPVVEHQGVKLEEPVESPSMNETLPLIPDVALSPPPLPLVPDVALSPPPLPLAPDVALSPPPLPLAPDVALSPPSPRDLLDNTLPLVPDLPYCPPPPRDLPDNTFLLALETRTLRSTRSIIREAEEGSLPLAFDKDIIADALSIRHLAPALEDKPDRAAPPPVNEPYQCLWCGELRVLLSASEEGRRAAERESEVALEASRHDTRCAREEVEALKAQLQGYSREGGMREESLRKLARENGELKAQLRDMERQRRLESEKAGREKGELQGLLEAERRVVGELKAQLESERGRALGLEGTIRGLESKLGEVREKLRLAQLAPPSPPVVVPPKQKVVAAPEKEEEEEAVGDEHDTHDNPLLPHFLPSGPPIKSMDKFIKYVRGEEINLHSSQLLIFVDCTKSNEAFNESFTFPGGKLRPLHDTSDPSQPNPYQSTISILGTHLETFDDDKLIPLYGFGDRITKDKAVFPYDLYDKAREVEKTPELVKALVCAPRCGIKAVLQLYEEVHGRTCDCKAGPFSKGEVIHVESCPRIKLQGGTSFAPAIRKSIELVSKEATFTICLIICDGAISENCLAESEAAVMEASKYPISIVAVGVGDGEPHNEKHPEKSEWHQMEQFDEHLQKRKFDNFHFVEFNYVKTVARKFKIQFEECFALMALSEVPQQYLDCKGLGYVE